MRVHDVVRTALGRKEFIAPRENKAKRKDGARGVISGVMGKRDQFFLVMHAGDSTPAVYLQEELQLEPAAYWKLTYQQHGLGYFIELPTYEQACDTLVELEDKDIVGVAIEGPFFSDKKLTEGLLPARSLFDRLKD